MAVLLELAELLRVIIAGAGAAAVAAAMAYVPYTR